MVQTLRPTWTVEEIRLNDLGTDAVYYITVEADGESLEAVLKACTAIPPPDFRPEPYLCRLLTEQTSIPVPRILGIVDDHEEYPSPFYLMERCPGRCAAAIDRTPEQITQIARAAGRYIGEYHRLGEFQRFGRLRLDCDVDHSSRWATIDGRDLTIANSAPSREGKPNTSTWREYSTATWRAWFESLYRYWIENLDDRFIDLQPEIEAFVKSRIDTLDRSFNPVLSHIDYGYENLLVQPDTGETAAVLDWGHSTALEPYYDLVVTEHHLSRRAPLNSSQRQRVRAAIEDGYSQTNTLDRSSAFEKRRQLYLLQSYLQPLVWFSEWYSDAPEAERRVIKRKHRQFVSEIID